MRYVSATFLLVSAASMLPLTGYAQTPEPPASQTAPADASGQQAPAGAPATTPDINSDTPTAEAGESAEAAATSPSPVTVGADGVSAIVGTLSPLIEDVQVVGPWTEGDRTGVWRAVMARDPADPAKSHFFIQQIAPSPSGAEIARSVRVEEVAALGGAVVGYSADQPTEGQENSLTLFFEIVPSDGEISETYELNVQTDGSYAFGTATN
ncbi:hypothetical protein U0C82_14590 [Fulvimarina sp. 2208YS6-2-32]|uniref:DNA topoisomerase IV subunit B n=1 Tax=Fulvimarina uroteuthidis TaxID=3098149 RepID=A0ABU5I5J7_9HYPH|nr:hypothetical protein [Fulvimarina sp. 2208YS6-2-32]MDY8110367.1 hypothetical protein [Fulvimarina sp. 2208YS6-2-32]